MEPWRCGWLLPSWHRSARSSRHFVNFCHRARVECQPMFVGHLAVAFASKPLSRSTQLGWFVTAVAASDLLWPFFMLAGVERVRIVPGATLFNPMIFDSYPWSHSLVMTFVWGVVLAAIARWVGVERKGLILIWLLVVSHWLLDFVTHAPDMP